MCGKTRLSAMCVWPRVKCLLHRTERDITGAEARFIEGSCSSGYCGRVLWRRKSNLSFGKQPAIRRPTLSPKSAENPLGQHDVWNQRKLEVRNKIMYSNRGSCHVWRSWTSKHETSHLTLLLTSSVAAVGFGSQAEAAKRDYTSIPFVPTVVPEYDSSGNYYKSVWWSHNKF